MKYLVIPAVKIPATHKAPDGQLVNVHGIIDRAIVHSQHPVVTELTGYKAISNNRKTPTDKERMTAVEKVTSAYNKLVAAGVTLPSPTGGAITLASTDTDRNNFTQMISHLSNLEETLTGDSLTVFLNSPVSILDKSGKMFTMTVTQVRTLIADYGLACLANWTAFQLQLTQIAGATSVALLNLIVS